MLRSRIIPCLLIHKGGLVKTVRFGDPKYVGDPLNAVRIFNEKEVDELMVVDIDASRNNQPPNEALIANLAAECRMPLCYGGGVRTAEQVSRLIALGVEKVAVSSAAVNDPDLIPSAAAQVGSQSIVGVIDYKCATMLRKAEVMILNGKKRTGIDPVTFAQKLQALGVGEIVLNAIDRDGTMSGYDLSTVAAIRETTDVPLTVLGGAGSIDDIGALVNQHRVIGAAAGSLFVFKGKYRAVLINYPDRVTRDMLTDGRGSSPGIVAAGAI